MRKTWLNVGQSQGSHTLLRPYTKRIVTSHIVPEMSNIPCAFDRLSMYHGSSLPPSRYALRFFDGAGLAASLETSLAEAEGFASPSRAGHNGRPNRVHLPGAQQQVTGVA